MAKKSKIAKSKRKQKFAVARRIGAHCVVVLGAISVISTCVGESVSEIPSQSFRCDQGLW